MTEDTQEPRPSRQLWFTRRGGEVHGPFPASLIRRYVLVGRLQDNDEVSLDRMYWAPIRDHAELTPELVRQAEGDEEARQRLMAARLREDERRDEDRRGARGHGFEAPERRGVERRQPEPDWMVRHRSLKTRTLREGYPRGSSYRFVLVLVVLALGVLSVLAHRYASRPAVSSPKCSAPPAPGVDWSYCSLEGLHLARVDLTRANLRSANLRGVDLAGANLFGTNLAYASLGTADLHNADLSYAQLLGAGLGGADLRDTDLSHANLGYADLRGARIQGAKLAGARLDQAIWTDGRVCADGSRGECR
ncbi:MAG: hypothetical protein B7Z66_05490 [Chromatiales bacterium 21-64-14]|nr:MAG: hypothetical protein B7Z66_05490 [Chromatiales bacterium 21-64-14]HQU15055.1 pentapeptide repeat-containing protein [Gammaproteobacteria bacterium]